MQKNKIRLLVMGILYAVYGALYTLNAAFPFIRVPISTSSTKSAQRDLLIILLIGLIIGLLLIAVFITSFVFGIYDRRNRWLYWVPLIVLAVVGIVTIKWPLPAMLRSEYLGTVPILLLGVWMILRAVQNKVSPYPIKNQPDPRPVGR
ncbi:hypothetical protein [Schleiferilactobacillus harbinensis]|uniref:Uncharacterized protein n=1 Tax=Schleiferilactobacillus harbinensis TaxID=304207 RepID=A0ABU7T118_9LACO